MAYNISVFAIPVYWLLSIMTRNYTHLHLRRNTIKPAADAEFVKGDTHAPSTNANPHSSNTYAAIEKSLSPSAFARWERIQAAHKNINEQMPLYFASIILGNLTRLDALELSVISWLFIVVRIFYAIVYIAIDNEALSYLRSASFGAGLFLNFWLICKAGYYIVHGYHALH